MEWLEIAQRVEGLKSDLESMRTPEEEYPETLEMCIEYCRKMLIVMDFADEIENGEMTTKNM